MPICLNFTYHAVEQMVMRNLTKSDVFYVYQYGRRFIAAGMIHIYLGKKDIRIDDRKDSRIARLEGTTVLLDSRGGDLVITVYRNRESIKKDRRKVKYNTQKNTRQLPLAA